MLLSTLHPQSSVVPWQSIRPWGSALTPPDHRVPFLAPHGGNRTAALLALMQKQRPSGPKDFMVLPGYLPYSVEALTQDFLHPKAGSVRGFPPRRYKLYKIIFKMPK